MKKDTSSFAFHRKRAKDNLVWLVIVLGILWFASSCSSERRGCQMRAGYIGYGSR
jgi:hypothetical protein